MVEAVRNVSQAGQLDVAAGFSWGDSEWFRNLERTEEQCRAYFEELRWPDGVICPRCDSRDTTRIPTRPKLRCRACKYQFSVTAGTILHNSHLPLWKWYLTVSLMLQSEDGVPANQLVRLLGGSYKTAWFVEHRVRAAIQEAQGLPAARRRPPAEAAGRRVFDRPLVGPFHQMDTKYVPAYRAEFEWRTRGRDNPDAFRDTVLALIHGGPLPWVDLIHPGRTTAAHA